MAVVAHKRQKHRKTKVTLESFEHIAKQEGYSIVPNQTYIKSRVPLWWKCPNNHDWSCSWDNWRQEHRCKQCYYERPRLTKHTLQNVRQYIENERAVNKKANRE